MFKMIFLPETQVTIYFLSDGYTFPETHNYNASETAIHHDKEMTQSNPMGLENVDTSKKLTFVHIPV